MAKRKKSESIEPSGHRCNWAGCLNAGDFRAPRSRTNLREYQWFCEEHIVAFNKNWNYFEGMGEEEIYAFQRDATTGHRPTWRMDQLKGNPAAKLEEAFGRMFGDGYVHKAEAKPNNFSVESFLLGASSNFSLVLLIFFLWLWLYLFR
jgi:hypothetical protein